MKIGDVLLVTGMGSKSAALVTPQKLIYSKAKSSHVEVGIGDGTFVHATGDGGVHITFILDELSQIKDGWRAIRLKNISEQQQENIGKHTLHFLRQGYNKKFMGSGNDHSSFCSELVAKAYKRASVDILDGKTPSKVAPAHFDKEADLQKNWLDVTDEYKDTIAEIQENPFPYRFACQTIQMAMAQRHITSQGRERIFKSMEALGEREGNPRMQEIVNEVKKFLRENRELSFWDEKDQD